MQEARAVLARLGRIEELERDGVGVPLLLAELRELVREATEWAGRERDARARQAAETLARAQRDLHVARREALHRAHEPQLPSASAASPIE